MTNTLESYNRLLEAYIKSYETNQKEDLEWFLERNPPVNEEHLSHLSLNFLIARGARAVLHAVAEEFARMSRTDL